MNLLLKNDYTFHLSNDRNKLFQECGWKWLGMTGRTGRRRKKEEEEDGEESPGLEKQLWRQRKGFRNWELVRRPWTGKGNEAEFGSHLNHYSVNGSAEFSNTLLVAKSNGSLSEQVPPLPSSTTSQDHAPVSPAWLLSLSLSACSPGICPGLSTALFKQFLVPHQTKPPLKWLSTEPSSQNSLQLMSLFQVQTPILKHLPTYNILTWVFTMPHTQHNKIDSIPQHPPPKPNACDTNHSLTQSKHPSECLSSLSVSTHLPWGVLTSLGLILAPQDPRTHCPPSLSCLYTVARAIFTAQTSSDHILA